MNQIDQINEHINLAHNINLKQIQEVGNLISLKLKQGNKVLIFGNGGSAADAQHFAAELVGRFQKERNAMPAIALTTDSSILTAISNDYGFENVFIRQLQALLNENDIVIGISTSGRSENVIRAIEYAKTRNCITITLTGKFPNQLAEISDYCLSVDSIVVARIQEIHILMLHLICEIIES